MLTQSQLFNASTNYSTNYSTNNNYTELEKDQFRSHSNSTGVTDKKLTNYHNEELNNRKTNSRTNQMNRRCKKSKKSTNYDTSFKENDDQENRHCNKNLNSKKNKTKSLNSNKNVNNINLDKDIKDLKDLNQDQNRKNLNDRLNNNHHKNNNNKKMRNSSSGTEEGYSSLDDCGSTSSTNSCTIVVDSSDLVGGLSNDDCDKGDHSNETTKIKSTTTTTQTATKNLNHHHLHYHHSHLLTNNKNQNKEEDDNSVDLNQSDDHLDVNSSDHSTVSSTRDLNLTTANENDDDSNHHTIDYEQNEIEQSTEQYLSSIWQQLMNGLNVGKEGYLTLNELFIVCEHIQMNTMDEELVKQLFDRLDEDKDGKVSFDELLKQLTSTNLTDDTSTTTITAASCLNENDDFNLDNLAERNCCLEEEKDDNYENDLANDQLLTKNNNNNNGNSDLETELTTNTIKNKTNLSLPYSSYKNYFNSSTHNNNSESFNKEHSTFNETQFKDVDNVATSALKSKHQRTNSFSSTINTDCLNVPSINNTNAQQQSTNSLLSSYCCCSTLNNQSKTDYGFTNSVDNSHHHLNHLHNNNLKHCNQHSNKLLSSSSNNTSSSTNKSFTNPSSSNESTINQPLSSKSHQTSSNLTPINEQQLKSNSGISLSELSSSKKVTGDCFCCCANNRPNNHNNLNHTENEAMNQGDIYKRNSIDKFSTNLSSRFSTSTSSTASSNQSTPEIEHTQLLNSINHQFNSSHLYHQTASLNNNENHHLPPHQANEEDFYNLNGFGNLLSLDQFQFG